jgi:thioredoxin 1
MAPIGWLRDEGAPRPAVSLSIPTKLRLKDLETPRLVWCTATMICAASLLLASGAAGFSFGAAPGSLSLRVAQQSARTVAPRAVVLEISSQEEFDKALGSAGDSLVVIDYSTSWCGPCKIIAPKFDEFSEQYKNVAFLKVMGDSSPEADKLMRSQVCSHSSLSLVASRPCIVHGSHAPSAALAPSLHGTSEQHPPSSSPPFPA